MSTYDSKKPHEPYSNKKDGADTLILFIHGFFGSPSQFWDLSDLAFEQGCSVASVLLPGHGGTGKQFAQTKSSAWKKFSAETIKDYAECYDKVILVGHSMGGVLSLEASLKPENHVVGLILINTPLHIKFAPRGVKNGLMVAFQKPEHQNEITRTYSQINSVGPTSLTTYLRWIPRVLDLGNMMSKMRRRLPEVTVPVLIIQSRRDETINWKSARILDEGLLNAPHRLIWLDKSWHSFYYEEERKKIQEEFLRFLKEN